MTSCNLCGKCCSYIEFAYTGKISPDAKQFYQTRGCVVLQFRNSYFVQVPSRCPHLTEENLCDIHDTKPKACRDWGEKRMMSGRPGYPEGCGFNPAG